MTQRIQPSLVLNGAEVLNFYRTWSYLRLGSLVPSGIEAGPVGCVCPALWRDVGSPVFVSPAADPAPWYDAAHPESADFLGALVYDAEGLDASMVTREFDALTGDGARLARQRTGPFEITFRAWLVARTDDGMTYGRLWLANRLASCMACDVRSATVRLACPPDNGSDDARGRFSVYGVGLSAGVTPVERPLVVECPYLLDVEWSMVAEDGYLYTDPVAAVGTRLLVPQDFIDTATPDSIAAGLWVATNAVVTAGQFKSSNVAAAAALKRVGVAAPGDRTTWRNVAVTAKHHTGSSVGSYIFAVAGRLQNAGTADESYLMAHLTAGSGLTIYGVRGGTTSTILTTVAAAVAINTDYWLRLVVVDDNVTAEHWTTDPALGGAPAATQSGTMSADQAANHPQGGVGIVSWVASQAAAYADDFRVVELPGPADEYLGRAPADGSDWLGNAATPIAVPETCTTLAAPSSGERGAVVTIAAGPARPVSDVVIHADPASYPTDLSWPGEFEYPMSGTGDPILPMTGAAPPGVLVTEVPAGATLVVDTARRAATLTVDGVDTDAAYLLGAPAGSAFGWPIATWCDDERVCVQPLGFGSDDGTATVTVQTRTRQR